MADTVEEILMQRRQEQDGREVAVARPSQAPVARPADMRWTEASEADIVEVLKGSLYPGASDASIRMVLGYCKTNNLNVMQKPVHIVPMYVKPKEGQAGMRDVVMPGISLYRMQASRSGEYMGMTLPEWGPMVTYDLDGMKVEVPEWCRITVRRLVAGQIVDFPAEEYWIENYATAGRDTKKPNAMWGQRSRGQLAKVTEAQALRKGFPEFTLGETMEEMQGKTIDQTIPATAAPAAVTGGATKQLDRFAGQTVDAKVEEKVEPKQQERKPKPKVEQQDALPTEDTGEMPAMPNEAENLWQVEGKWSKGWKWLNEVMPTLGPGDRQRLADEHHELLWAVNDTSAAYSKAALEFVRRMGVVVKERAALPLDQEEER